MCRSMAHLPKQLTICARLLIKYMSSKEYDGEAVGDLLSLTDFIIIVQEQLE
jgi:hypothetical protein